MIYISKNISKHPEISLKCLTPVYKTSTYELINTGLSIATLLFLIFQLGNYFIFFNLFYSYKKNIKLRLMDFLILKEKNFNLKNLNYFHLFLVTMMQKNN